ncbi:hypothetical protein X732_30815 [Mesorhizobium sp. L2C066B000]|nr:hypothetical protein X732_30815 [Mesorhizobium sp. L2C066B000]
MGKQFSVLVLDALDEMVADGRMARPKRIKDCAIWAFTNWIVESLER